MRVSPCTLLLLLLASVLALAGAQGVTFGGGRGGGKTAVVLCPDVPPDKRYTCEAQAYWGKCDESWMFFGAPRDPGSFCAATCGRCSSSNKPPSQVVVTSLITVEFTVVLRGYRQNSFGVEQQASFTRAIGQLAGVDAALVVVRRVRDMPGGVAVSVAVSFLPDFPGGPRRGADALVVAVGGQRRRLMRRLLQSGLSLEDALGGAGFELAAPAEDVTTDDTAVSVAVPEGEGDVADESVGFALQAASAEAAESGMEDAPLADSLPTPAEVGVAPGEETTVDISEEEQAQAVDAVEAIDPVVDTGAGEEEAAPDDAGTDGEEEAAPVSTTTKDNGDSTDAGISAAIGDAIGSGLVSAPAEAEEAEAAPEEAPEEAEAAPEESAGAPTGLAALQAAFGR